MTLRGPWWTPYVVLAIIVVVFLVALRAAAGFAAEHRSVKKSEHAPWLCRKARIDGTTCVVCYAGLGATSVSCNWEKE